MNRLVLSSQGSTRWIVWSVKEAQDESSHLVKEAQDKVTYQFGILILNNASKRHSLLPRTALKKKKYMNHVSILLMYNQKDTINLTNSLNRPALIYISVTLSGKLLMKGIPPFNGSFHCNWVSKRLMRILKRKCVQLAAAAKPSTATRAGTVSTRNRHHQARRCIPFEWL